MEKRSNEQMLSDQWPHWLPVFLLVAAVLLVSIYVVVFHALPWTSDPSAWGSFGDYIGGLLNPVASTLTLIIAIKVWAQQRQELEETKQALKDQAETAQANRREQRFFDLMQVYQQTLDSFQDTAQRGDTRHGKPALDEWIKGHTQLGGMINTSALRGLQNLGEQRLLALLDNSITAARQHWIKPEVADRLNHYFRVIFRILHDAKDLLEQDRHRFIRLFRAQLSQTELLLLGLNLWITDEGQKMLPIACDYGLLKHLPQCNLRDVLERDMPPLVFGRRFAEIKANQS
jgi:Putative phage abortive infection protein